MILNHRIGCGGPTTKICSTMHGSPANCSDSSAASAEHGSRSTRWQDAAVEGNCLPPSGPRTGRVEPDASTAHSVVRAIKKKLGKDSYRPLISDLGSGYLHIFLSSDHFPLFDGTTLSRISARLREEDLEDQDTLQSISFGYRDHVYCLWPASDSPDPTR